ncbi:MAG: hypothetical protein ACPGVI_01130 [Crocinitomicaceae bacterium]
MLRILFIALSTIIFFSCGNNETSEEVLREEVIDNRTELEKNIVGKWFDKQDSTAVWVFTDTLVKWKGYSQTVDYKETFFEVGSIRYEATQESGEYVLVNKTTGEKHVLTKKPAVNQE